MSAGLKRLAIAGGMEILVITGTLGAGSPSGPSPIKFQSESAKLALIREPIERWKSVKRLLLEYDAIPSQEGPLRAASVHRSLALSAPGDLHELAAHFADYPWQVDPFRQEVYIHSGIVQTRFPSNRSFSEGTLKSGTGLPGSLPSDLIWSVIPVWLLRDYAAPTHGGAAGILAEAIRSPDYRLRSESATVAGEACAIFEKEGVEEIYVATNKSLCVMQRLLRSPTSGQLIQSIRTDKLTQIAPGLWLPTEFQRDLFSVGQSGVGGVRKDIIRISRYELNDKVQDSTFIPNVQPGLIRADGQDRFTQITAGGEELLDDTVSFLTEYAHLPAKRGRPGHPVAWVATGLMSGLLSGMILLKRKKPLARAKPRDGDR